MLGSGFVAAAVTGRLLDRLLAGTNVTVYGRDQHAPGTQLELGAARAASPADLAARSVCVLVITESAEEVERQLNGPNGLRADVQSPTTAIIGAVMPPAGLSALSGRVIAQTAGRPRRVDTPLSVPRLSAVNCPSRSARRRAALPRSSRSSPCWVSCSRVGGLGTAQKAHACRQLVSAATAIGMSEATTIAERAGLDAAALGVSPGQPLLKPLPVAADVAERGGARASLVDQLRRLADQVAAAGLSDQDLSTACRILVAEK